MADLEKDVFYLYFSEEILEWRKGEIFEGLQPCMSEYEGI